MRAANVLGYASRCLSVFLALSLSRFDGEFPLPPRRIDWRSRVEITAASANCELTQHLLHVQIIRNRQIRPDFQCFEPLKSVTDVMSVDTIR
jgi:hypothetical protein